jgi:hypothetical protein
MLSFLTLVACLDLPDPTSLPSDLLPTPEATDIRVETEGTVWYLEPEGPAVLTRYLGETEVLTLQATGDVSSLGLAIAKPTPLAVGDTFPLGRWGDTSTASNGIAIGGLVGLEPIGLTTDHPDDLAPVGTVTITTLDEVVGLVFDGELFREDAPDDAPVLQAVSGEVADIAVERETVDAPAP